MPEPSQGTKFLSITTILIYSLLAGGLASSYLPIVQVKSPLIGTKSWGVQDLIKSLPKSSGKKKKDPIIKVDYDFMDVLKKILPKNSKTNEPKTASLTFILGILVPIALALTYFLLIIALLVAPIKRGPFLS